MSGEDLTNVDIVLYALYLLGGARKKVFTEDIALKSFELEDNRFSWRRYPKYPDIEPARKALMEARNQKKMVAGRAGEVKGLKPSDGWIFSPNGISWIEKNKTRIANMLGKNARVDRTDISRQLNDLEKTAAYKIYLKEGNCVNIKPYQFTDFLSASLDTPSTILRDRINKISALAASGKKTKLLDFISQSEKQFSVLINP